MCLRPQSGRNISRIKIKNDNQSCRAATQILVNNLLKAKDGDNISDGGCIEATVEKKKVKRKKEKV